MGIASGYEVKTDTDKLLVIGRYVVSTAAHHLLLYNTTP